MDEEYGGFDEGMDNVTGLDISDDTGAELDEVGSWMDEIPEAEIEE